MSAKPEQRVLRIGIIQGGKIVEERLLRKRRTVTIGLSPRNTFVLPVGHIKSHVLFDVSGGRYDLCFGEGMDGRVAVDGNVFDLAALKVQGLARRKGDRWQLQLGEDSRGKVVLGDVTVLFQFVTPPPVPAAPKLPAVARGGWVKSIDWIYTAIVVAVGIVEAALIGYMQTLPVKKEEVKLESLDARFARLLVPELIRQPERPKPTAAQAAEGAKKAGAEEGKGKRGAKRRARGGDDVERAKEEARGVADVREKVGKVGMLGLIGSVGPGGVDKAVTDVFAEGGVDRDVDSTFKRAESIALAEGGLGRGRAPKGGGAEGVGTTETIGDEKVTGVGVRRGVRKVDVERGEERTVPKPQIGTGTAEVEGGSLDPAKISSVVRRRLAAIKGCYERSLRRNPDLQGKISVRFTIGPTGAVVEISVESNTMGDEEVARCIVSVMRGWRFPKPEGGSVTVAYPFIFTAKG
jgi:TonB family protein